MSQRSRQIQHDQQRRARLRTLGMVVAAVVVGAAAVAFAAQLGAGRDGASGDASAGGSVRVSLTEFAFAPDPIVVDRGAPRLEIVNDGTTAHDLVIPSLGKGTPDLPAGDRMVLDLSGQPAGTYRVVCDLPGHTEAGMVTELTIE
jgi:uncharacterized cupredoxin-like copper-binding protein